MDGWCSRWSSHDWTTATQHWPVCHRQLSHLYNGYRTDFRAEHPRACHAMSVTVVGYWLPVRWRVQFKVCCVMHYVFHGTCPAYLSNIAEPVGAGRTRPRLRSTSTTDFSLPRLRTKFGERSFSHVASSASNDLPEDLRAVTDPAKFIQQLKTYFFSTAFNVQWLQTFRFNVISDSCNAPIFRL